MMKAEGLTLAPCIAFRSPSLAMHKKSHLHLWHRNVQCLRALTASESRESWKISAGRKIATNELAPQDDNVHHLGSC